MHYTKALALFAIAGTAAAAPAPHRRQGGRPKVVYETVVHTVIATKPWSPPAATPAPAPEPTPTPVEEEKVTPAPEAPASSYVEVEVPASSAAPATEPSSDGYMAVVDEWRAKLGLSKLEVDSTLEANALKTAVEGNGEMVHQLNPGSMGQVLAPGGPDDFFKCFVGGWLCERPDMAGMDGVCSSASEGWMYTSTGHADILTSPDYKKIGCGNGGGIWACDLGN